MAWARHWVTPILRWATMAARGAALTCLRLLDKAFACFLHPAAAASGELARVICYEAKSAHVGSVPLAWVRRSLSLWASGRVVSTSKSSPDGALKTCEPVATALRAGRQLQLVMRGSGTDARRFPALADRATVRPFGPPPRTDSRCLRHCGKSIAGPRIAATASKAKRRGTARRLRPYHPGRVMKRAISMPMSPLTAATARCMRRDGGDARDQEVSNAADA